MGKVDALNTPSVHTVTSIGSQLSSAWIVSAMGIDSAEHPTNRTARIHRLNESVPLSEAMGQFARDVVPQPGIGFSQGGERPPS